MSLKSKLRIRWYEQCGRCLWCGTLTWAKGITSKKERRKIVEKTLGALTTNKVIGYFMATVEHIKPKSKKGSDNIKNLVCACRQCNLRRANNSKLLQPHPEVLALLPASVQASVLEIAGKG